MRDVGEKSGLEIIQLAKVFGPVFEFEPFVFVPSPVHKDTDRSHAI